MFVCHPDRYACRHSYIFTIHRSTQSKIHEAKAGLYTGKQTKVPATSTDLVRKMSHTPGLSGRLSSPSRARWAMLLMASSLGPWDDVRPATVTQTLRCSQPFKECAHVVLGSVTGCFEAVLMSDSLGLTGCSEVVLMSDSLGLTGCFEVVLIH